MAVYLSPVGSGFQFLGQTGLVLSGGKINTYAAGTTNPTATFTDITGTVQNANPIILDSTGRITGSQEIWFTGGQAYKFVITDSFGVTQFTLDNLQGIHDPFFLGSTGIATVNSIAALRTLSKGSFTNALVTGYYAQGDKGGGLYYLNPADTTSTDNGGTIIVANDGGRWYLNTQNNTVTADQFGAKGDNSTDNYPFFNAALTWLGTLTNGGILRVIGGSLNKYQFKAQGTLGFPTLIIPSNTFVVADPDVYYIVNINQSLNLPNAGVHTYGGNVGGVTGGALFMNGLSTGGVWTSTGTKNLGVIGGNFKNANTASGSNGNNGFVAFKNCIYPLVRDVRFLDVFGACRYQQSFVYGARLINIVADYETPHLSPWSFEDVIRVGSGSVNTIIENLIGNGGDDIVGCMNEAAECQDTFASPVDSRIPASNTGGALITRVIFNNGDLTSQQGHAFRLFNNLPAGGSISVIRLKNVSSSSTTNDGTVFPTTGTATQVFDVVYDGGTVDCTNVTQSGGSPGIFQLAGDHRITNYTLNNVNVTYGIITNSNSKVSKCTVNWKVGSPSGNDGIYIGASDVEVEGCTVTNAPVSGIHVDAAANHTRLIGNRIPSNQLTGNSILETTGAQNTYAAGNDVNGGGAASIANNTGSVYFGNPGYNPIGTSSIGTPGTSLTYTSATSPELITVVPAGAISSVTINGTGTGLGAANFSVMLPPHTTLVINWAGGGPTVTKTVH